MEPVDLANTHTRDVRKPSETRDGTRAAAAPAPARIQAPADTVENTPRVSEDHKGAGPDNTADATHAPVRVDPAKADTGTLESKSSRSHQSLPQVEPPAGPGKRTAPSPTHLPAVPEAFIPAAKSGTTGQSPPPATALESSDSASSHTFSSKPPATAAHHPRDRMIIEKRLLFKRMLLDGKVFRKYGRRGFPHARRVVLSADLRYIMWGSPNSSIGSGSGREKDGIAVSDIQAVDEEPSSEIFRKNASWVKHANMCFSLVSATRTLDLEASSVEEKEEWVTALLCLKKYRSTI
jgi:hypothetical protein